MASVIGLAFSGDAGHTAPDLEGEVACGTMLGGSQVVVAAELEMVVNASMSGQEALGVPR